MKLLFIIPAFVLLSFTSAEFKQQQLNYPRVRDAYTEKEAALKGLYESVKSNLYGQRCFIKVYKEEKILEVWTVKPWFCMIKSYPICAASGLPGPKRKQGDNQVPEGIYKIDRFNPASNFHLSLGINYPNTSDQILSDKIKPGGDIFIHGSCVSIGCMAMTDDAIKEIYIICVEATQNGQSNIPVYIFPFKMTDTNIASYSKKYPSNEVFWNNLKTVYRYLEEKHTFVPFVIDSNGNYLIN